MIHTDPIFIEVVAPIVALILYARIKVYRRRAKLSADGYTEPEFASASPKIRASIRLGMRVFPHHSPAEEVYLRAQLEQVRTLFLLGLYFTLATTTTGIYYDTLHILTTDKPPAPLLWANFLHGWTRSAVPFLFFALIAGFILSTQLVGKGLPLFYRSRPISLHYIFWTRSVIATFTLIATLVTGFALSFLVLYLVRGPVWSMATAHAVTLNATTAGTKTVFISPISKWAVLAYFTSPFRIALSNILSTLAIYALITLIVILPFKVGRNKTVVSVIFWTITMVIITLFRTLQNFVPNRFTRTIFLYSQLGTPPPYIFAFVPLALFAAFFVLARISFTYREG
jgi:hypothetical protein